MSIRKILHLKGTPGGGTVRRWESGLAGKCPGQGREERALFVCSTQPTRPDRGWFVAPFGKNPWWVYPASILPALLVTILIFMDQQITAVIVNRKENKLRVRLVLGAKPEGMEGGVAFFHTLSRRPVSTWHV
jgi:hypothetical protein